MSIIAISASRWPVWNRSARLPFRAVPSRAFSMDSSSSLADGAIDIRLVPEQQIKRRPRHVGGARDVVHCRAGETIGEKHLHRAVQNAGARSVSCVRDGWSTVPVFSQDFII